LYWDALLSSIESYKIKKLREESRRREAELQTQVEELKRQSETYKAREAELQNRLQQLEKIKGGLQSLYSEAEEREKRRREGRESWMSTNELVGYFHELKKSGVYVPPEIENRIKEIEKENRAIRPYEMKELAGTLRGIIESHLQFFGEREGGSYTEIVFLLVLSSLSAVFLLSFSSITGMILLPPKNLFLSFFLFLTLLLLFYLIYRTGKKKFSKK
jgi:Rad3-related DNA helicase